MVAVSAILLAAQLGSPSSAAEPTVDQLGEIMGLLESNDVQALRDYLNRYPELTEGDTTLAQLLHKFMVQSVDIGSYLGFEQDLSDAVAAGNQAPSADDGPGDDGPGQRAGPVETPREPAY